MSLDDEYQAHKRRQESMYVLAYEEFEKNLSAKHRRLLGAAAIPDIEDTRSHGSRRVSLGVLTDAAERVSASYTPDISEQVDGTGEDPSPELLAEMLGLSVDLVKGAILEEINPTSERLAESLGVTRDVACRIFEWHNRAAASVASRIKMRAIVRIAGVFLECENSSLAAAGLAFVGDLALRNGLGSMEDCAASVGVSIAAFSKNIEFWQRELELDDEPSDISFARHNVGGILGWHRAASARKAEKIKRRAMERIAGGFLDCANSKLTAAGLAYAADLALTAGLGTMQDYALKIAVSRAAISKNAKFWQRELDLPAASNMRALEKCKAYSEAQKTKHWRNQKFTLFGV
jgi:hypothetical protein